MLRSRPATDSSLSGAAATTACAFLAAAGCCAARWILANRERQRKLIGGAPVLHDPSQESVTFGIPNELREEGGCPYHQEVRVAVELALAAGRRMVPYCDARGTDREGLHDLRISEKGSPEDFCTHIDLENERSIAAGLRSAFPSHRIIGEEATGTGSIPPLTSEPTWIVDPIDGTTNFAAGLPLACVSLGLCLGKVPMVGVVFAPLTRELYLGARGCGAFRNGARLGPRSDGAAKPLAEAVVCAEFGYARDPDEIDRMTGALKSVLLNGCRTIRVLGSGVLDLCYVASGRLDVVYAGIASEGWKPWDFCAACVLLKEAGSVIEPVYTKRAVSGSDNQPKARIQGFDLYSTSHICASSQELLEETRRVLLQNQ